MLRQGECSYSLSSTRCALPKYVEASPHLQLFSRSRDGIDGASYPTLFDTSDTTSVSLVLMRGMGPALQLDTTRHCSTLFGARYERCLC
jgi:hypothetical protein